MVETAGGEPFGLVMVIESVTDERISIMAQVPEDLWLEMDERVGRMLLPPHYTVTPYALNAIGVAIGLGELIPDVERFMAELPGKTLAMIQGVYQEELGLLPGEASLLSQVWLWILGQDELLDAARNTATGTDYTPDSIPRYTPGRVRTGSKWYRMVLLILLIYLVMAVLLILSEFQ